MRSPEAEPRFGFGENWQRFSRVISDDRVDVAQQSLRGLLGVADLSGRRFLDVGSGSGLFSLAARRLGAEVESFDYDADSVSCTEALRQRYRPGDERWRVSRGSILDAQFLAPLGRFDVVYSWGVLHHTGNMHEAFERIGALVAPGGTLAIAIYNDQGWISRYWTGVKRVFNSGAAGRVAMIVVHAPYLVGARYVVRALTGRLRLERGMSLWYDMVDWLGGWPFEVARPEAVVESFRARGFDSVLTRTVGTRMGCNEFVFRRA